MSLNDERGFVSIPDKDWISACINVDKNLYMLPFGKSDKEQRQVLDDALKTPDYFRTVQNHYLIILIFWLLLILRLVTLKL